MPRPSHTTRRTRSAKPYTAVEDGAKVPSPSSRARLAKKKGSARSKSTATRSKSTAAPSNSTAAPSNSTAAPSNSTAAPSNSTAARPVGQAGLNTTLKITVADFDYGRYSIRAVLPNGLLPVQNMSADLVRDFRIELTKNFPAPSNPPPDTDTLSVDGTQTDPSETWEFVGSPEPRYDGSLWKIYRGQLKKNDNTPLVPVVLKVMRPRIDHPQTYPDEAGTFTTDMAVKRARTEANCYRHLSQLQGTLIPAYYGMFEGYYHHQNLQGQGPLDVVAILLEDVGPQKDPHTITPKDFTLDEKRAIFKRYQLLHDEGQVAQDENNIKLNHILRRKDVEKTDPNHWVIVDFQRASSLATSLRKYLVKLEESSLCSCLSLRREPGGKLVEWTLRKK